MALQVWLPLNKDLRQQGLSNVTVTNNGATFNSAGKLGGCYTFGSGKYMRATPASNLMKAKSISVACWIKITSWNSSYDCLMSWADGTGWTNSRVNLARNNTNSTLRFTIADGSSYAGVNCTTALALNTWYHVVGTYDGSNIKIYINGNLEGTVASTISIIYAGEFNIGGWSGNNYPINGNFNDVRLYDHCLSPMEVKELAKGLVLHYPLNRQGWGQENLLKNTNRGTTNWSWSSNGGSRTVTALSDGIGVRLESVTAGTQWSVLQYQDGNVKNVFVANKKYIVSVDCRASYATRLNCSILDANGLNYIANTVSADKVTIANEWVHLVWKLTANSSFTVSSQEVYITNAALTAGTFFEFKNLKLEEGEYETPWCPNSSDALATTMGLNSTTEYDCSGFCNNGIRMGTFTWTSDTPKYQVSQVFASGNNYIDCGASQEVLPTDGLTVSLWCKYSTWGNPASCTEGGGWNFENNSGIAFPVYIAGVGYKVASSGITPDTYLNQWHMITGTFDKTNVKIYIDGVLKGTVATGSTNGVGYAANHCYVGAEAAGSTSIASASFIGSISDFRIYATALSADDVKSLYQNSAYIDSSGNVYGAVHTEV